MAEPKKTVQYNWFLSQSNETQRIYTTRWKFAFPEIHYDSKKWISSDTYQLFYSKMTLKKNGLSLFVDDVIEYYDQDDIKQKGEIWFFIIEQFKDVESSSIIYILLKEKKNGKVYKIQTSNIITADWRRK
eukprot:258535_1